MRHLILTCLLLSIHSWLGASQPNILFILADDLAWSDLGCYGHTRHRTPHLDRLAGEGLRFTQAYAPAPICSASRAALLTGRTPARLNFEFVTKDKPGTQNLGQPLLPPPFTLNLNLSERTVAEVLGPAGYHTAFYGKWHLNQHHDGYLGWSPTHGPLQQGFAEGESDFGSHPYAYWKTGSREHQQTDAAGFTPDSLTDKVCGFLKKPHDRPFLLWWSHYYVHDPVHTRSRALFEKYRRQLPADQPDERALYAAMVETLDNQVGRVLNALDECGLSQNTLVIFMSDNGGHPDFTGNGPLRGSKWNLYEGGIRVPMIARWPGHISPASTCEQPVHGCDILPTLAHAATADIPGQPEVDGRSLLPLFTEPQKPGTEQALLWHFPYYHPEKGFKKAPAVIGTNDFVTSQTRPHSAIRRGNHKLLYFDEDRRIELYDLQADPGETGDLSEKMPALAASLKTDLEKMLQQCAARRATSAAGSLQR